MGMIWFGSYTSTDERQPLLNQHEPARRDKWVAQGRLWRAQYREYLAEFIGTCVLIILLCGVSAEQTLHVEPTKSWLTSSLGSGNVKKNRNWPSAPPSNPFLFALVSGIAVLMAIGVAGHVSGAHINPAVTLTFWCFSGFPSKKVPGFIAAQILGAFTGAAILYSVIFPAINELDHGERQLFGEQGTAGIFATFPAVYVPTSSSILSEIVGTALLLLIVMATGHENNLPFRNAQGCFIAAGITSISISLGYTSGFSLNPARDLGPRLFIAIAGWGWQVFQARNYYFLIPMLAPFAGALIGGAVYTVFIDQ
ncbi:aquaporin-like protein [Gongronella butleri]|nr:aquaporin-like protein [Gongronella butleri]